MRNLKKILAMVLALVMSLSLMATAGATNFKDDGDITDTYRQAIEVLSTLGVFNGEDGNFYPERTITRAEVAAIIYRITTGDVTDSGMNSYSVYDNQFTDVKETDWFAGYVSYCHNAGYVKGHADHTFGPQDPVTGYQALAMILRAVGYDKNNEFVGDNWQINTASIATTEGVLDNVKGSPLGGEASRALVAEILFRSILLNNVEWNIVKQGYDKMDTHVCDTLKLEELTGVVMANEWADLENDTVMKDGLTRLDVDGKDYTLEISTPITAIGEMRHAYVQNGTTVIGNLTEGDLENPGVSIIAQAEVNGGEASKVADVAKKGNVRLTNDTEYFVNFGEGEYYTSEWQIRYSVQFDDARAKANFTDNYVNPEEVVKYDEERDLKAEDRLIASEDGLTYTKTIRANMEITGFDMLMMQGILGSADDLQDTVNGTTGYVRRVAESTVNWNANQNATTYYSWNRFFNECIVNNATNYTESDNGEWLKIIDKDGDGNADYVLRTDFVMTVIEDTVRDSSKNITAYRMEYKNPITGKNVDLPVDEIKYDNDPAHGVAISEEDMVEGAVILYTYIDGVYHVASPKTASKASAKTIDLRNETVTFTIDGEDVEKGWSGIERKDASRKSDITSVDKGVSYTLYYDHFGYVRLFEESSKGFVLMTDGYYATDRRNDTFKVTIYNDETQKLDDVDVADSNRGDADRDINRGFINTTEDAATGSANHQGTQTGHGNASTWQRLNTFGFYNYNLSEAFNANDRTAPTAPEFSKADQNPYTYFRFDLANEGDNNPFNTNIAAYEETDKGYNLYDVDAADTEGDQVTTSYHAYTLVTNSAAQNVIDIQTGEQLRSVDPATVNGRTLWGIKTWEDSDVLPLGDPTDNVAVDRIYEVQRIHTNANTKYYWVVGEGINAKVVTWTGFNAPSDITWNGVEDPTNVAYVVTSSVSVNDKRTTYETAEIVVFEGKYEPAPAVPKSGVIAVKGNRLDGRNDATRAGYGENNIVKPTVLYTMGWNGAGDLGDYANYDSNLPGSYADTAGKSVYTSGDLIEFYRWTGGKHPALARVDEEYYKYNFFAGYVVDERGTDGFNDTGYGYLNRALNQDLTDIANPSNGHPAWHNNTVRYDRVNVPVYKITAVTNDRNRVGYDFAECELTYGDMVLYLTDGNTRTGEKAMMIWNVTESIKEGNEEIIWKLIGHTSYDFDHPLPYTEMTSGLWNDVRREYEDDQYTHANEIVVNVNVTPSSLQDKIPAAIKEQTFPKAGIIEIELPATDFTAPGTTGWSWTAPSAGNDQDDRADIQVYAASDTEKAHPQDWTIVDRGSGMLLQLAAPQLNAVYNVELNANANTTKNTITVSDGGAAANQFKMLTTNLDIRPGETKDIFFAVSSKRGLNTPTIAKTVPSGDPLKMTLGTVTTATTAELTAAGLTAPAANTVEAGATWNLFKVAVTNSEIAAVSGGVTLTFSIIDDYDLTVTPDANTTATATTIAVGTKLNQVSLTVTVDPGYVLAPNGQGAASHTIVKMGTKQIDFTIAEGENPGEVILTLVGEDVVTDTITVALKALVAPPDTQSLEDELEQFYGNQIELTDVTPKADTTDYDFEVSADSTDDEFKFGMYTEADETITITPNNGRVTATKGALPRTADTAWTITVDAKAMREAGTAAALKFTLTVKEAPKPSAAGELAAGTTGKADTPAAALSGTPSLSPVSGTTGAADAKQTYTVDLSGVSFTTYGKAKVTVNGTDYAFTAGAADTWKASLVSALNNQIADGLTSGKYAVSVAGDTLTFEASENGDISGGTAISSIAIAAGTAGGGAQATYTITITSVGTVTGDVSVKLGGKTWDVTVTEDMTATQFATALVTSINNDKLADTTAGTWTASSSGAVVTLTAANKQPVTTALTGLTFEAAPAV